MSWFDNLDIIVEDQYLFDMNVDAIVCPTTIDLGSYGYLSRTLMKLGGEDLVKDIKALKENIPDSKLSLGQAVSLDGRKFKNSGNIQKIILAAAWDRVSEYTSLLYDNIYTNSLREAFDYNLRSIAFPVMGYDGTIDVSARSAVKVFREFDKLKQTPEFSIEKVYFVSNKDWHIRFFTENVEEVIL